MNLEFPEPSSTSTFFFFGNIVLYSRASNSWWASAVDWEPAGDRTCWRWNTLETEHSTDRERGRLFQGVNLHFPNSSVLEKASSLFWISLPPLKRLSFSFFLSFAVSFCTELPHTCVSAEKPVPLLKGSHSIRHGHCPTFLTSCSITEVAFGVCLTQAASLAHIRTLANRQD